MHSWSCCLTWVSTRAGVELCVLCVCLGKGGCVWIGWVVSVLSAWVVGMLSPGRRRQSQGRVSKGARREVSRSGTFSFRTAALCARYIDELNLLCLLYCCYCCFVLPCCCVMGVYFPCSRQHTAAAAVSVGRPHVRSTNHQQAPARLEGAAPCCQCERAGGTAAAAAVAGHCRREGSCGGTAAAAAAGWGTPGGQVGAFLLERMPHDMAVQPTCRMPPNPLPVPCCVRGKL